MRTLFPAASACFVVAFVASVGYAESQIETQEDANETAAVHKKSDAEETNSPVELSVAPMEHLTYPDDRPSWISAQPDLHSDVHTWVVTTSGTDSLEQSAEELDVLLPATVALYIKETTGWICDDVFLDPQWIDDDLVGARYVGTFTKGDQTLHEIAVQLRFDQASRQRIQKARQNSLVNERIRATGGMFALGLIGLFCTGGLLGVFSRRYT